MKEGKKILAHPLLLRLHSYVFDISQLHALLFLLQKYLAMVLGR